MKLNLFFFGLISLLVLACSNEKKNNESTTQGDTTVSKKTSAELNVIKVYVSQDGNISADGNIVSLVGLDSAFSVIQKKGGTVYYSRANANGEPPAASMDVIDMVAKHSLPIRFYTDSTFATIATVN